MFEYTEQYYKQYFQDNYSGSLRREDGAEECLNWAKNAFQPGRWLDVGAGPCSFFWASAAPSELESITLSDRSLVPLEITKQLAQSGVWPTAYEQAVSLLGRPASHLNTLASIPLNLLSFDAFSNWPSMPLFHSISAFGLLGLANSSDEVVSILSNAKRSLAKGGVFLGASWMFSDSYAERIGRSKQHLNDLASRMSDVGFKAVNFKLVPLTSQGDYTGIVLFQGRS